MLKKEAKFVLNSPNADKPTYIFLRFSCHDGQLKYSVQEKILPKDWNPETQRSRKDKKLNKELERLSGLVESYQEHCKIMGKHLLKEELTSELNNKSIRKISAPKTQESNFFPEIQKMIDEAKEGTYINTEAGRKFSPHTTIKWQTVKNVLFEYNPNLTFDAVNMDFYNHFMNYCNDKNFSLNYVGTLIAVLKKFMSESFNRGLHKNVSYKDEKFKALDEITNQVYLNQEEIQKLIDVDLSDSKRLSIVRDRYLINLVTGLRISDMKTLTEKNINEQGIIVHNNQKTGKKVSMPVHAYISAIQAKYGGKMPKQYSQALVNENLKEIAKRAGINSTVRFTKTIGGKKQVFVKKKWEMITNHTGRRTMVTNLLKFASMQQVMPVTGMSVATLMRYNKITAEENAMNLQENEFFKKKNPQ